ncbi:helix-turn-helix transcriptional regulator [Methanonatronarchaeum sp. AMET-Sl]|uniref:helix-turn-helix transcriptional regulator n=1 Tax=Methanonatronarchaeum sp. AMET-Sl TaxID=3037654 RepID=UPI00244DAFB7|nr:helix-turn-helix transcriptional regulator [Methanonatronarchaeum sp. AMET-Sl]WGI17780.1 helix-turn-helix transcriptional regulator [Methanonatronarchaeum sp. AMET-Sl]
MSVEVKDDSVFLPDWAKKYAQEVAGSILLSGSPGSMVKKYRAKTALTQSQVSNITGVSRETVSRIENDKLDPSYRFIRSFTGIIVLSRAVKCYFAKSERMGSKIDLPYLERIAMELDVNRDHFEEIAVSSLDSYDKKKKEVLKSLEV